MLFLPETLLPLVKEHQAITTHNTNRHCRFRFYACLGQPLSKQLHIGFCLLERTARGWSNDLYWAGLFESRLTLTQD